MKSFFIKQDDECDCGACCLDYLIKYYKGFVPIEIIKQDTYTTKEGTTFYNLKEAGLKYGFVVEGRNTFNYHNLKMPFIAQIRINEYLYHFIVVYKIDKNNVYVMDPAKGYWKYSYIEFNKLFTGNILNFYKESEITTYKKNKDFINMLKKLIKEHLITIIIILSISIFLVLLSFLNIYFIKILFNKYHQKLLLLFIILLILKCILNYVKDYLVIHLNRIFNTKILFNYIRKFFVIPFKNLQLKNCGDIISRINDLNSIKDLFTKEIINILLYSMFLICAFLVLFNLSWKLTIALTMITLIYFLLNMVFNRKLYHIYLKYIDSNSLQADKIIEYVSKIKTIRVLNKETYFLKKLISYINSNFQNEFYLNKKIVFLNFLKDIYSIFSLIIILLFSLRYLNMNDMFMFLMYFDLFYDSIIYFSSLLSNISYFRSVLSRVNDIYYIPSEDAYMGLKTTYTSININNLSYKINTNILFNKFNLKINSKDKVLLIGDNGSGKSTLLNILFKTINNYEGEIYIDKTNIRDISLNNLKTNISYVRQDDVLFGDTIKNNIILDEKYDEAKFNKIVQMLDINNIVKKKSLGYNSFVKDNLSGGERQRIILARGLYRNFEILFIDEALSEVSHYLRLKIINNINNYYKDKIIIYVSHMYEKYPFNKVINLTARKEI